MGPISADAAPRRAPRALRAAPASEPEGLRGPPERDGRPPKKSGGLRSIGRPRKKTPNHRAADLGTPRPKGKKAREGLAYMGLGGRTGGDPRNAVR